MVVEVAVVEEALAVVVVVVVEPGVAAASAAASVAEAEAEACRAHREDSPEVVGRLGPREDFREAQGRPWEVRQVSIVRVQERRVRRIRRRGPVRGRELAHDHRWSREHDRIWVPDRDWQVVIGHPRCQELGPALASAQELASVTDRQPCLALDLVPESGWESLGQPGSPIARQHCLVSASVMRALDFQIRAPDFRTGSQIVHRRLKADAVT
jgi:hypothetical protein